MFRPFKILVAATLLFGLAACTAKSDTPPAAASPTATVSLYPKKVSCLAKDSILANGKVALDAGFAALTPATTDPTKQKVAIEQFTAGLTELAEGMEREAKRAGDAELKALFTEYATSARAMLQAVAAAGTDADKAKAAVNVDAIGKLESRLKTTCA